MQQLDAEHKLLFSQPTENGRMWVYEIEITNTGESPLDQVELVAVGLGAGEPGGSPVITIETLGRDDTFVIQWEVEQTYLTDPSVHPVTYPLFFSGRGHNASGALTAVEVTSLPYRTAKGGVSHD